jgi:6-phosphogluconolactonase (cycloisomerase 2 family)
MGEVTGGSISSSAAAATSTGASSSSTGSSSTGTSAGTAGSSTGGSSTGASSGTTSGGPGTYVYIESNDPSSNDTNAILAYQLSGQTLVPRSGVSSFALGGRGVADTNLTLGPLDADQQVVIDRAHQRLYAVNEGSNTIGGFDINGDGSLSAVAGSPFSSGGDNPVSLEPVGDILYVANQAYDGASAPNYTALRINADGSLSAIAGIEPLTTSAGASPSQVLASPDQMHLFGVDFLGIRSFNLTGDGGIVTAPGDPYAVPASQGGAALGLAVHPTQNILYVGFSSFDDVGVFSYDSTGALTYITDALMSGSHGSWLRVTADGSRMYAVNAGDASISVLDLTFPMAPVETQHFLLKDSQGTPFVAQGQQQVVTITSAPYQEALSPDGQNLFVVSQRVTTNPSDTTSPGNLLHILAIAADGTLSEPGAVVPIEVPLTTRPQGVASIQLP